MRNAIMITSCIVLGLFAVAGLAGAQNWTATVADVKSAINYTMSAIAFGCLAIVLTIHFRPSSRGAQQVAGAQPVMPAAAAEPLKPGLLTEAAPTPQPPPTDEQRQRAARTQLIILVGGGVVLAIAAVAIGLGSQ